MKGKAIRIIERQALKGVNGLTMSPDGEKLFTLDHDGNLRVEEVATGAELLRQQFPRERAQFWIGDFKPAYLA